MPSASQSSQEDGHTNPQHTEGTASDTQHKTFAASLASPSTTRTASHPKEVLRAEQRAHLKFIVQPRGKERVREDERQEGSRAGIVIKSKKRKGGWGAKRAVSWQPHTWLSLMNSGLIGMIKKEHTSRCLTAGCAVKWPPDWPGPQPSGSPA